MKFESTHNLETIIAMEGFFGYKTEEEYLIAALKAVIEAQPDIDPVAAFEWRVYPQLRLRREARREIEARREGLEWPTGVDDTVIEKWAALDPARIERMSTRDKSVARDCAGYVKAGFVGTGRKQKAAYGGYLAATGASVKWPMYEKLWCWA